MTAIGFLIFVLIFASLFLFGEKVPKVVWIAQGLLLVLAMAMIAAGIFVALWTYMP